VQRHCVWLWAFCAVRLDLIGSDPDYWTEAAHLVGNGPYVLTAWVHGSYLTLSKTLTYHSHGQVTIDEIQFRILDDAGQLVAYENDQLDVSAVPSDELPRVLADPVLGGEFHRTPQPGVYFLGMNTQLTPTNNITVRMFPSHGLRTASQYRGTASSGCNGSRRPTMLW